MWGQLSGQLIDAGHQWHAVLNIDRDRPHFGRLLLFAIEEPTHWRHMTLRNLSVANSGFTATTEFSPYPFDLPFDKQHQRESTDIFGGTMTGNVSANELRATLKTLGGPSGTNGEIVIGCVETDAPSQSDYSFTWPEFKEWVSSLTLSDCPLIFRGHERAAYRLKTSLHRTGRRDLIRYREEDLPCLAGYVCGVNGRTYRLNDFHDYNNLLSLGQHHGYPTPLLDWTESPYIAAFFALRDSTSNHDEKCRVYAFDIECFQKDIGASEGALEIPHLSLYAHRAASRDHGRALPQQSVFMLSNVVEIELFVAEAEQNTGNRYLTKIDLPKSNTKVALAELRSMGITEASMFPGLDGICREMRQLSFQ